MVVGAEAGEVMGERLDYGGVVLAMEAEPSFASEETVPFLRMARMVPQTKSGWQVRIGAFYRACGGRLRYSTHGLQADVESGEVHYFGYRLRVSRGEARVAICLLRHAPGAVDTNTLMELCFCGEGTTERSLFCMIMRINRAAREITELKLVKRERGMGYRLAEGLVHRKKT